MDLFVKNVRLEDRLSLQDFMAVVRDRAKVEFARPTPSGWPSAAAWWNSGWRRSG